MSTYITEPHKSTLSKETQKLPNLEIFIGFALCLKKSRNHMVAGWGESHGHRFPDGAERVSEMLR